MQELLAGVSLYAGALLIAARAIQAFLKGLRPLVAMTSSEKDDALLAQWTEKVQDFIDGATTIVTLDFFKKQ